MTARCAAVAAAIALWGACGAAPARAVAWSEVRGHVGVGLAKLAEPGAPGGSLSVGGGLDLPVRADWRAGVSIAYHLLGSKSASQGSLVASLDYNAFEALLLATWQPRRLAPLERVSLGTGLVSGHVEIQATGGGGAAFRHLAKGDTAPALGLDATLLPRRAAPVRVGLELSSRHAFFGEDPWTLVAGRVVFHY
jgi:hypothetical protein